jgi:hypothetical protein
VRSLGRGQNALLRRGPVQTANVRNRRSFMMKTRRRAALAVAFLLTWASAPRGDEFGRLDGPSFFDSTNGPGVRAHSSLSFRELDALPTILRDERSAFVIVRTDQGNLAKILVTAGLRKHKPSQKDGPLAPVLLLERFETISAGDRRSLASKGKDVMLFDGFQFDLDAGQVVPEGFGGDIVFSARAPDEPRLAAVGESLLYTLEKRPVVLESATVKPSAGRGVVPGDFAGRYSLTANGQWSGTLELDVDGTGVVSGRFRSDRNGSSYPVTGKVAGDFAQKIVFSIKFPRARQDYEGLLWTEGKNAIAGSLVMLDHPYSFIAIREGTSLGPKTD